MESLLHLDSYSGFLHQKWPNIWPEIWNMAIFFLILNTTPIILNSTHLSKLRKIEKNRRHYFFDSIFGMKPSLINHYLTPKFQKDLTSGTKKKFSTSKFGLKIDPPYPNRETHLISFRIHYSGLPNWISLKF